MTVSELIERLHKYDMDRVVVIGIGKGWGNIHNVIDDGITITLEIEKTPLFSES